MSVWWVSLDICCLSFLIGMQMGQRCRMWICLETSVGEKEELHNCFWPFILYLSRFLVRMIELLRFFSRWNKRFHGVMACAGLFWEILIRHGDLGLGQNLKWINFLFLFGCAGRWYRSFWNVPLWCSCLAILLFSSWWLGGFNFESSSRSRDHVM